MMNSLLALPVEFALPWMAYLQTILWALCGGIGMGLGLIVALKTFTMQPLAAGASVSVATKITIPAGTTPGAYFLVSKANFDGAVAEVSSANNTATFPLTVSPR